MKECYQFDSKEKAVGKVVHSECPPFEAMRSPKL